jgi:putative intracellular protease/amidase/DNA-directed RNA polymerase subunit RPC12/RpoP
MKLLSRREWLSLFALLAVLGGACLWRPPAAAATKYRCVPCSLPCDDKVFDAPGTCPVCGMRLVTEAEAAAASAQQKSAKKVAILVFDGCEILDFTGPYEMFGAAGCDVYTVAAKKEPVTTAMGLTVVPKFTFAGAPPPDVLVIPGGGVKAASEDRATLDYIKQVTATSQHTMSVCNGAFILANTGLLDGLSATTTNHYLDRLGQEHPRIKVVRDKRYADNGKLITTAGLSAGMDGALHVIAKLFGTGYAQGVALGEEYAWTPNGGFVRATMADQEIPELNLDATGDWRAQRLEGDTRRWDAVIQGKPKGSAAEFQNHVEQALTNGKWTRVAGASGSSRWKFTGRDGKPWRGTVTVGAPDAAGQLTAEIQVARES